MLHELRIYTCLPGQLPRLLNRFETLTLRIWQRHGIRQAGFWTTAIGPASNDLTYMIAWENLAERDAKWAAFAADPEWQAGRDRSEEAGPIIANIASSLLQPVVFGG